ncbi:MAG: archaeosortase/exosortase family protein [Bacteroidetes bacterium]|nr:archaeosortase/exosortase family protein [Bacteroidota bacterium]
MIRSFFATIKSNPLYRFVVIAFLLYTSWYILYEFFIKPLQVVDLFVVDNTISTSESILNSLGFKTYSGYDRLLGIDGTNGLWIGDKCNGIELFSLFAIFIIAYPGKFFKKFFFIPIGIGLIHVLNIARVVGLAIVQLNFPEWTEFNHTYIFNVIIYGVIFCLWIIWINKFSGKKLKTI